MIQAFSILRVKHIKFSYSMNTQFSGFVGLSLNEEVNNIGQETDLGLRIKTTIKSDLQLDGLVKFKSGELVKFAWNIPRDKMHLISVR